MRQVFDMSRELAERLAGAAEMQAGAIGILVAVAVVDRGGHPVVAVRMDGAATCAWAIALSKAETAAATLAPTAAWYASTQPGQPDWGFHTASAGRYTCMPGGLPVIVAGEVIGAISISGGESAQDAACAEAALRAVTPAA